MSGTDQLLAPDPGLHEGEVVLGRYEAKRLLGAGGMGEVWVARDRTLGRDVALKLLHAHLTHSSSAAERFEREARVLARLGHDGVVRIFDFGREGERLFLVMELVAGVPVDEELARSGPFDFQRAARLALAILDVLVEAHALGIVHRDLKPSNLLLVQAAGGERAKLLDFGIAAVEEESGDGKLTRQGTVLGTPAYMSPEQCRGLPLDGRSDLYSLGCVLYELLVGDPPFGSGAAADLMSYHLYRPVRAPGKAAPGRVPEALDRVIVRALQKRPADRFPDAAAMRAALAELVDGASVAPPEPVRRARVERQLPPSDVTADGRLGSPVGERIGLLCTDSALPAEVEVALSLGFLPPVIVDADTDVRSLSAIVALGTDGRDALALSRPVIARPDAPPLVLCGGEDDLDLMTSAIEAGVFDYVPLPLDSSDLVRKVERAARRGRARGG